MANFSFFAELRKRKVVQAAAIYGAIAWGVTEVLVTIVDQLFLPQWVSTLAVIFFVVGFPVAMFLAWTFDITSEGIRRTEVSSRRGTASIVASLVLLVAGTAGLFFLIRPSLQVQEMASAQVAVAVQPNSLAVLPFVNVSGQPEDAYLVGGLSDQLRDQLSRVSGLRIAARSSSVAAVKQGLDALTASARLGVASLVEGNVRRQGDVLYVSVQVINGGTGLADWSGTYERGPRELLGVQQAIAEAVVAKMLPDSEFEVSEPATRDPTANELMLLARHYELQVRERQDFDQNQLLEVVRLYRQATEADPESALAHSRLAGALIYLGDLEAAEAPIFKALSLAPNLSEVQNTLGEFYFALGRPEASTAWERAVEINPNNPDALSNYARYRWWHLKYEGVDELYRRALELDPLNLERYASFGSYLALDGLFLDGSYEETKEIIADIEELFEGAAAWRVMAELLSYLGEVDKSIAWTLRARNLEPDNPAHVQKLAEFYADIGDQETALRLDPNGIGVLFKTRHYDEMIDLAEFEMIDEPRNMRIRSLLAIAYNATGRYESAIYVLRPTGLPESMLGIGARSTAQFDGFYALMNALFSIGEIEMASDLAGNAGTEGYPRGFDWWTRIAEACDWLVLGEDELARDAMLRAQKGWHLPWDPVLKDAPCFTRFQDDPVYQATVRHFDEHRARLRERLPATLAEFGVKL